MRRKLAKHVKKLERRKQGEIKRSFHRLPPFITSTLAFHLCTTLFPITRSTRNEKYKRGRRRRTNVKYPKEKKLP